MYKTKGFEVLSQKLRNLEPLKKEENVIQDLNNVLSKLETKKGEESG